MLHLIRTETGEVLERYSIEGMREVEVIALEARLRAQHGCDDIENGLDVVRGDE